MNPTKIVVRTYKLKYIVLQWIGRFFLGLNILLILTAIFNIEASAKDIVTFTFGITIFVVIDILLIKRSYFHKKWIGIFKDYVLILADTPVHSIKMIADKSGKTESEVTSNLQYLINKRFFYNARIDYKNKCLVLPGEDEKKPSDKNIETVSAICDCCGGLNHLPQNMQIICRYCGNIVKKNPH